MKGVDEICYPDMKVDDGKLLNFDEVDTAVASLSLDALREIMACCSLREILRILAAVSQRWRDAAMLAVVPELRRRFCVGSGFLFNSYKAGREDSTWGWDRSNLSEEGIVSTLSMCQNKRSAGLALQTYSPKEMVAFLKYRLAFIPHYAANAFSNTLGFGNTAPELLQEFLDAGLPEGLIDLVGRSPYVSAHCAGVMLLSTCLHFYPEVARGFVESGGLPFLCSNICYDTKTTVQELQGVSSWDVEERSHRAHARHQVDILKRMGSTEDSIAYAPRYLHMVYEHTMLGLMSLAVSHSPCETHSLVLHNQCYGAALMAGILYPLHPAYPCGDMQMAAAKALAIACTSSLPANDSEGAKEQATATALSVVGTITSLAALGLIPAVVGAIQLLMAETMADFLGKALDRDTLDSVYKADMTAVPGMEGAMQEYVERRATLIPLLDVLVSVSTVPACLAELQQMNQSGEFVTALLLRVADFTGFEPMGADEEAAEDASENNGVQLQRLLDEQPGCFHLFCGSDISTRGPADHAHWIPPARDSALIVLGCLHDEGWMGGTHAPLQKAPAAMALESANRLKLKGNVMHKEGAKYAKRYARMAKKAKEKAARSGKKGVTTGEMREEKGESDRCFCAAVMAYTAAARCAEAAGAEAASAQRWEDDEKEDEAGAVGGGSSLTWVQRAAAAQQEVAAEAAKATVLQCCIYHSNKAESLLALGLHQLAKHEALVALRYAPGHMKSLRRVERAAVLASEAAAKKEAQRTNAAAAGKAGASTGASNAASNGGGSMGGVGEVGEVGENNASSPASDRSTDPELQDRDDETDYDSEVETDMGFTQLHTACMQSNWKVVRRSLREGSNINARTPMSAETPLHLAAMYAKADLVRFLLRKGADPRMTGDLGSRGKNALDLARKRFMGDEEETAEVVKAIEEHMASFPAGPSSHHDPPAQQFVPSSNYHQHHQREAGQNCAQS
jgi:hypothetical protein